jgi:hypothetical protein
MFNNISDDKLFFDIEWYREQTLNISILEGGNLMNDPTDKREDKGSGDIKSESEIADKESNPCHCCEEIECRLPANEWTDD